LRKAFFSRPPSRVIPKSKGMDLIRLGTGFYIGAVYDDSALSDADRLNSIWLDLRTEDPDGLKQKILEFGCKQVGFWDKEHFYFQAPGGQVFRLVGKTEAMSKWQQ